MTPVKRTLGNEGEAAAAEGEEEETRNSEDQLTQLEAIFRLEKIDLHIDEALNTSDENDEGDPFLSLTLQSIVAKTKIKTFDMEFDASLANLIVYHEQFVGKDNQQLRLLSAELHQNEEERKLVSVSFLHTSPENPLFYSSTYNGIENKAHVHMTKLVVILQLEALLSILRFQDALMKKLPKDSIEEEKEKKQENLKVNEENKNFNRSISTAGKNLPKKNGLKRISLRLSFSSKIV